MYCYQRRKDTPFALPYYGWKLIYINYNPIL